VEPDNGEFPSEDSDERAGHHEPDATLPPGEFRLDLPHHGAGDGHLWRALCRARYELVSFRSKEERNDSGGAVGPLDSEGSAWVRHPWRQAPVEEVFDAVILSCEVGVQKPDPRVFLEATSLLAVDPIDTLWLATPPRRTGGAAAVGIDTLILPRPEELQPRGLVVSFVFCS
jgi:hypothetical protein